MVALNSRAPTVVGVTPVPFILKNGYFWVGTARHNRTASSTLSLTSCVILGKLPNLSVPQFLQLYNEENKSTDS